MTQIFANAFEKSKDNPITLNLKEKLIDYCQIRKKVRPYQKEDQNSELVGVILKFLLCCFLVNAKLIQLIPGIILFEPILLIVKRKV